MDKISVVIPVYNRADWIGKTLDRIFSQKHDIYEVVICDDGSTDALTEALQPYSAKVKLITITNSGPAIARKTAIEHATGDWIALCDSDDFWLDNHLAYFLKAVNLFPEMNFYFSDFHASDAPERSKLEGAPLGWLAALDSEETSSTDYLKCNKKLYAALLKFQPCFQSACLFRRTLYEQVGGIDPAVSRWPSEDFHLTLRLAAIGRAVICTIPTVIINKHEQNFSADILGNFEGRIDILEKIIRDSSVEADLIRQTQAEVEMSNLELFRLYYWHNHYQGMLERFRRTPKKYLMTKDYLRLLKRIVTQAFSK
ncbi:glycosyltransferase family 2 protein [Marinobacter sp.]|uniref:glycosyltransferase family 2 protein n=1 Tax=Marinobacter sp. TaxID=50741 RepID=UPI003A9573C9